MNIADFIGFLTWNSSVRELDTLKAVYDGVLAERFGAFLGGTRQHDTVYSQEIMDLYRHLPDEAFIRFLRAPETSHRLLWGTQRAASDLPRFVRDSLMAEAHRSGVINHVNAECWTALGDYVARPGSSARVSSDYRPFSVLRVDFESPHARAMRSPWDTNPIAGNSSPRPTPATNGDAGLVCGSEQELALELLDRAIGGLASTAQEALDFAAENNFIIIIRQSPLPGASFSSSSPEKFIGSTVLWMGHDGSGDEVDIADALIHEAVHSVLDMHEFLGTQAYDAFQRWFRTPVLYDGRDRTISPWTGNPLALLTFIHACFVWFAEVQFWTRAIAMGAFDKTRSIERLVKASRGFLRSPLTDQLDPYRNEIHPDLYQGVRIMQATVESAFASGVER